LKKLLEQAEKKNKLNKITIDLVAVKTQLKNSKTQFNRTVQLNSEGLKAPTDVEEKRLKQK
jgi:hypothetical protein